VKNLVENPIGKININNIDYVYSYAIYEENGKEKFNLINKVYYGENNSYVLGDAFIYRCDLEHVLNILGESKDELLKYLSDVYQNNISSNDDVQYVCDDLVSAVADVEDSTMISIEMSGLDRVDLDFLTVFVNGYDFTNYFESFKTHKNHTVNEIFNLFMHNPIEIENVKYFKAELQEIVDGQASFNEEPKV